VVYVEILVKPTFARCRAELHDVSAAEVELLLDGPLDPGAVLFLRLPGLRSGDSVTQMGRVADAARMPDGRWLIDCRLAHRLSGAQLGQILGPGAG